MTEFQKIKQKIAKEETKQYWEDKKSVEDFKEWERRSCRALGKCFRTLKYYKEMIEEGNCSYFEQYLKAVQNIDYVEKLVNMLNDSYNDFEKQLNFTSNTERRSI